MMTTFPFISLMVSTLISSTVMAISSANWLFLWVALEINMLSFIPLIMSSGSAKEMEGAVKYFLIQSLASTILLVSSMSLWYIANLNFFISLSLLSSLLMKTAAMPFHIWYPQVMAASSWPACFVLSTWQKVAPLMVIAFLYSSSPYLMFIAGANAVTGGFFGMNQSALRPLMAFSSIAHSGWVIGLISASYPLYAMSYFSMYSMIIFPLFFLFHKYNLLTISSSTKLPKQFLLTTAILLLSLSGIPPFTGFFPKWLAMYALWDSPLILFPLLVGSIASTYYYLNLVFAISLSMQFSSASSKPNNPSWLWVTLTMAGFSLFMLPLFVIWYGAGWTDNSDDVKYG